MMSIVLIILGLCLFETISSIDNAIINAQVLGTMGKKARRWFLTWGIFFAVFVVRGLLPCLIVYLANVDMGFWGAVSATFSSDPVVHESIERSAPTLLAGGGIFLILLFFHWLFAEEKVYGLKAIEKFFSKNETWFYVVASLIVVAIVYFAVDKNMALGATIGSAAFFITSGFKESAENKEKSLMTQARSDFSKIVFLEIIDLTFSIDGVLGAFAFTLSIPLILIGNGLGALIVRQLTVGNIDRIKKYPFLKNGAMYSILFLGLIMVLDSFGVEIKSWVSPVITFLIVGFFLFKSIHSAKKAKILAEDISESFQAQ